MIFRDVKQVMMWYLERCESEDIHAISIHETSGIRECTIGEDHYIDKAIATADIEKMLNKLSPGEKRLLVMFYMDGFKKAKKYMKSKWNVKSLDSDTFWYSLQRIIEKFRIILFKNGYLLINEEPEEYRYVA